MNHKNQFPWILDQISICLSSGIEFREALEMVTNELYENHLKRELLATIKELKQGRPREEALRDLHGRVNTDGLSSLADLVELSAETGAPLLPGIKSLAAQLRANIIEESERRAIRAPFWLLLPLLFAIFPATGLILLTPFLRTLTEILK